MLHDQAAGVYDISVALWTDWRVFSPLFGSPFRCDVAPAPTSAAESDVAGPGIVAATAGVAANFVITARDVFGNFRGVTGDDWKVRSRSCVV